MSHERPRIGKISRRDEGKSIQLYAGKHIIDHRPLSGSSGPPPSSLSSIYPVFSAGVVSHLTLGFSEVKLRLMIRVLIWLAPHPSEDSVVLKIIVVRGNSSSTTCQNNISFPMQNSRKTSPAPSRHLPMISRDSVSMSSSDLGYFAS